MIFQMMHLIRSFDVRLNNMGLIGQPCFTPALTLIGGVSSSREVRTTVVALVYMSLIKSTKELEKPI